jgi:4-amino-4-deoxy-L-arabinose transferase-like glycosyltransferase
MKFAPQRSLLRTDYLFLGLLVVALVVRIGYLIYYHSMPEWDQLTVDNCYHHHWAQSIASGNIIGDTTYFRAPLYVWCLGACYAIFGDSLLVARLFGLLVGLGSLSLTFLIARRLFDRTTALVAVALQALCPIVIYFESELLLDPLFMLLLQLSLLRLLVWFDQRTARNLFLTGLVLGLSAIARPTSLPLALPLLLLPLFLISDRRVAIRQIAVGLVGILLCVLSITARNLVVAGDPVLIASQGGVNFYIGNNPDADGLSATLPEPLGFNWRMADLKAIAESSERHPLKPGQVSDYWSSQAWSWIRSNPGDALGLYLKKLYFSFSNREISNNRNLDQFFASVPFFSYNPITFAPLVGLALIGILLACGSSPGVRSVAFIILALVLIDALFFVNSRFRLPILPLLIVTASYALVRLATAVRTRRWQPAAFILIPALLVGSVSRIDFIPLPAGSSAQELNSRMLYYYNQRDDRSALAYGRQALSADAGFPEVNLNLGNIWLRENNPDSASYYYQREIDLHPQRAKGYINLASMKLMQHLPDQAALLIDRALVCRPHDPIANALKIRTSMAQSDLSESAIDTIISRAVVRSQDDLRVLTEAGSAMVQKNHLDDAFAVLTRAVTSRPPAIETDDAAFDRDFPNEPHRYDQRKATAYYLLGFVEGKKGRFDQAIDASRQAIRRDSSMAEAYINLISACLASDKLGQAEETVTLARSRFPNNPQITKLSDALAAMKRDRE